MRPIRKTWFLVIPVLIIAIIFLLTLLPYSKKPDSTPVGIDSVSESKEWTAPDFNFKSATEKSALILYGRDLIANTAKYLGPRGSVASISNGMNCQNCHIDAGLKPFGNCFSAVASIYPAFRARSGIIESIEFRINDCLKRSLNGEPIDSLSKEMRAMVAYLKFVGKDVKKGTKPKGAGTEELAFMERAADPAKGKDIYIAKCKSCHGGNGEGVLQQDSSGFTIPPLWGQHSYNTGAGLYRLTRFAGFVKNTMPFGSTHDNPGLTDEESWDVAAFVNSQPRPHKVFANDWPNLSMKAIDYPFGPYKDAFSERQHKYGPFNPIKKAREKLK